MIKILECKGIKYFSKINKFLTKRKLTSKTNKNLVEKIVKDIKKNGDKFNAKIRITPTFSNGKDQPQTGYCGITIPIKEEVKVPIKFSTIFIKLLSQNSSAKFAICPGD